MILKIDKAWTQHTHLEADQGRLNNFGGLRGALGEILSGSFFKL